MVEIRKAEFFWPTEQLQYLETSIKISHNRYTEECPPNLTFTSVKVVKNQLLVFKLNKLNTPPNDGNDKSLVAF